MFRDVGSLSHIRLDSSGTTPMLNIIENSQYKEGLSMETLGDLIPKNKITLLHGRSGCGKTLSVLKYFENLKLETILLDFDTNDGITKLVKTIHLDGFIFWDTLLKELTSKNKDLLKEQRFTQRTT